MKREAARFRAFCTTQIILADVLSVIPVQTRVLGAQKNRLIGTVRRFSDETILLSTQDKCLLLRNQVICHLRILIWRSGYFFFVYFLQENIAMKTADRRSSLFKILKSFL